MVIKKPIFNENSYEVEHWSNAPYALRLTIFTRALLNCFFFYFSAKNFSVMINHSVNIVMIKATSCSMYENGLVLLMQMSSFDFVTRFKDTMAFT